MSSGVDLSINRSLELLGTLRQTAAKFAQREEQLARDLKTRRTSTTRDVRQAIAEADAQHAAQVKAYEDYFVALRQRTEAIYGNRRKRVEQFHANRIKNLPKLAQEMKQGWVGNLQMKNYHEQRKLTANMAAADAVYTGFITQLDHLRDLEKQARSAFGGYGSLKRMLRPKSAPAPATDKPLETQLEEVRGHLSAAGDQLEEFKKFPMPRFFRGARLSVLFFVFAAAGAVGAWQLGLTQQAWMIGEGAAFAAFVLVWIIHATSLGKAKLAAAQAAAHIVAARLIIVANAVHSPEFLARRDANRKLLQDEYERGYAEVMKQWARADDVADQFAQRTREKVETQSARIVEKIERLLPPKLQYIEAQREASLAWLNQEGSAQRNQLVETHTAQDTVLSADEKTHWDAIVNDWQREITPIYQAVAEMKAAGDAISEPWSPALVENWTAPADFAAAAQFGRLDLDLAGQPGILPIDPRLALPGPAHVTVPAALAFPQQGSLLFESRDSGDVAVANTFNNIILRLLSHNPPGKLTFTIIDPVRLGQNFAGLMHLGDYQESLINRRIWTQGDQIEERLAELGEHIEKVIQMYLRNEYATITEYNREAGSVAEKYHFLVIADFPAGFSETAAKRLQSIGASGPRCGIFTLMHWDQRQPMPGGFVPDEFRKNSISLFHAGAGYNLGKPQTSLGANFQLDPSPDPELELNFVHKIGKASVDSNRVEVPFSQIAPAPGELWHGDTSSELRIAIGRTGATKQQFLAIGKGTRQHALFAGKTGSGKSTLFHIIITNLAVTCSPEQVEFYLIDFKKGVEFKCYASRHLPHAKVVAIESDREFALSVLQRVDAELRRRGDIFRKLGVQDIPGYKRSGATEPMPRCLLIIDEFQEFFVEDDTVAQNASLLFDRIVRQGRAFGIHVLLGSQTLGGAYSLARATLGQMAIRVALQCNEADSYLIMDENNSAPRLLSRPGEGIYNDAAGAMEGNSPFQVCWLGDDERDAWLDKIDDLKKQHPEQQYSTPIVFEGNAPADIRENDLMRDVLATVPAAPPAGGRAWLGAPNSIKGPTEALFQRQSGDNLLIVGQREEAALTMIGLSMLALSAQYPKGMAKFILFQSAPPGTPEADFLDRIVKSIPHPVVSVSAGGVPAAMNDLSTELQTRLADENSAHTAPAIFLFVHGLQKFKKLKQEDDFSFSSSSSDGPDPAGQFAKLIPEGSSHGIHIITTVDSLNSVNNFMNRKALSEFAMRVVFQMSANDSASLIDSPKASTLGLHRAIFYNEHESHTETFRPYAFPEPEWLAQTIETLAHRA